MSDTGLIPFKDWEEMLKVLDKNTGLDNPLTPFIKEIFLIECRVAGTGYVEDIDKKSADLIPDSLLVFQRETTNPYDANAILILNKRQEKLGYVPKAKNEILARLMDGGKLIFGKVVKREFNDDWLNLTIKVFLRDF